MYGLSDPVERCKELMFFVCSFRCCFFTLYTILDVFAFYFFTFFV